MPEPKSPFKRVRRHFDRDGLKRVCEMHETEFAHNYQMQVTPTDMGKWWDAEYPAFTAYLDRGSDILAVAHLDTVQPHEKRTAQYLDTAGGPVIYSGALDDRLGAYTILDLLPDLDINVDVLLTVGEESGNSTAQDFIASKEYLWMVEFDRGGTDVVMYQYDDVETRDLVRASGARVGDGIFSDIAYLDHLEIKGFNWGVGYQDYHSPRSHAYLEDYWSMVGHFIKFHDANHGLYLPHEDAGWGRGRTSRDIWAADSDCVECRQYNDHPRADSMICAMCASDPVLREYYLPDEDPVDTIDGDVVSDDWNVVNERLLADNQGMWLG